MSPESRPGESPIGDAPPPEDPSAQHDITDAASSPAPTAESSAEAESLTPGGYSYTVVDDTSVDDASAPETDVSRRSGRNMLPWLALAAIVPAIIIGVVVWFFASGGGGGSERQNADVTSLLNLVGNQQGSTTKRYEGTLAPGFPDGVPTYPGARLLSSIRQVRGQDAQYLAVYDSTDARRDVSQYFADQFDTDPWQLQGGQTTRDASVHEFSRVDDPDVSGVVLVAESQKDSVSTILLSIQVTSGAKDDAKASFTPGPTDRLPDGFPDTVPAYPGSNAVQSGYQKQSGKKTYNVSFVTKDDASSALSYYKDAFSNNGWTVEDATASQSSGAPAGGQAIQFNDSGSKITGQLAVGAFDEDDSYTRIDIQVIVATASGG